MPTQSTTDVQRYILWAQRQILRDIVRRRDAAERSLADVLVAKGA